MDLERTSHGPGADLALTWRRPGADLARTWWGPAADLPRTLHGPCVRTLYADLVCGPGVDLIKNNLT